MEWVVRAGIATPKRLQEGYVAHTAVPGLYGFSVQYHAGLSVDFNTSTAIRWTS